MERIYIECVHDSSRAPRAFLAAYRNRRVAELEKCPLARTLRDDDEEIHWRLPVPLPSWARFAAGITRDEDLPFFDERLRGFESVATCADAGMSVTSRIDPGPEGGARVTAVVEMGATFRGIPVPESMMGAVVRWLFQRERELDEAFGRCADGN